MSVQLLVTIVTPVLNCAPYIRACLDSVQTQSYGAIEHVIADGASTDGTVEILAEYAARYPGKIRFTSQRDSSPGEAWNRALSLAKGDVFGWLGADDMLTTDAVEHVMAFMGSNPNAYFVHGACHHADEAGKHIWTTWPEAFTVDQLVNDGNFVAFPAAFYRREVVRTTGPVDAYGNDYDYVIRIAKRYAIHQIQKPLAIFRHRHGSETSSMAYSPRVRKLDFDVARRHGARLFSRTSRRYYGFLIAKRLGLLRPYYRIISPLRRRIALQRSAPSRGF